MRGIPKPSEKNFKRYRVLQNRREISAHRYLLLFCRVAHNWCLVSRARWFVLIPAPNTYLPIAAALCLCIFFRVHELNVAKMVVEKFLPFLFASSCSTWQELVGLLTSNTTQFPPLSSRRINHLLVEMYVATKVSGSWFSSCTFGYVPVHSFGISSLLSLSYLFETNNRLNYLVLGPLGGLALHILPPLSPSQPVIAEKKISCWGKEPSRSSLPSLLSQ